MANPSRVMARMVKIDSISPIDGADRIVAAHVGGWTVVVGKGDFNAGDLAVLFEIDSFLPADDSRYEQFAERGTKEMIVNGGAKRGHVLRTIRLRGTWSQGLLMHPQDVLPNSIPERAYEQMLERKANLTGLCGICEYNPMLGNDVKILRRYDPWVAPRTDAKRIQNVSEELFAIVKKTDYLVSMKVDGTSLTALFDPRYDKIRLFTHNNEISYDRKLGKQVYEQAEKQGIIKFLTDNPGITLQFEGCGPKINGNRLNLKSMKLFVFSAWDTNQCMYLDPYGLFWDFADSELRQSLTPKVNIDLNDFATTIDLIDYVDGLRGHVTDRLDEGLVIHVLGQGSASDDEWHRLQGELGAQQQVKVISRKYLLKAKD